MPRDNIIPIHGYKFTIHTTGVYFYLVPWRQGVQRIMTRAQAEEFALEIPDCTVEDNHHGPAPEGSFTIQIPADRKNQALNRLGHFLDPQAVETTEGDFIAEPA
jgi:hypothetical protein